MIVNEPGKQLLQSLLVASHFALITYIAAFFKKHTHDKAFWNKTSRRWLNTSISWWIWQRIAYLSQSVLQWRKQLCWLNIFASEYAKKLFFLYNMFSQYRESMCLLQIAANEYAKMLGPLRSAFWRKKVNAYAYRNYIFVNECRMDLLCRLGSASFITFLDTVENCASCR